MADWSKHSSNERPLDMAELENASMALATARTIGMLTDAGELDQRDMATARLALEIAERIDVDGLDVGVSLYARLWYCLRDLTKHETEQAPVCPMAQQFARAPEVVMRE